MPNSIEVEVAKEVACQNAPRQNLFVPLQSVEELLDLAGNLLETGGNSIEVERFVDGVSRLYSERISKWSAKTKPLTKRLLDLYNNGYSPKIETNLWH
ncbi:MAG: hypothetical protein ACRC46_07115 [Thermoguttaceae bacterium]